MRWLDRYHLLNGREFAQAPEVGDGQVCCCLRDCKESDATELN